MYNPNDRGWYIRILYIVKYNFICDYKLLYCRLLRYHTGHNHDRVIIYILIFIINTCAVAKSNKNLLSLSIKKNDFHTI